MTIYNLCNVTRVIHSFIIEVISGSIISYVLSKATYITKDKKNDDYFSVLCGWRYELSFIILLL